MRLPQEHRLRACGGTPRRGPEAEGGQSWGGGRWPPQPRVQDRLGSQGAGGEGRAAPGVLVTRASWAGQQAGPPDGALATGRSLSE